MLVLSLTWNHVASTHASMCMGNEATISDCKCRYHHPRMLFASYNTRYCITRGVWRSTPID